jgi:formylglycine-generating enzyme
MKCGHAVSGPSVRTVGGDGFEGWAICPNRRADTSTRSLLAVRGRLRPDEAVGFGRWGDGFDQMRGLFSPWGAAHLFEAVHLDLTRGERFRSPSRVLVAGITQRGRSDGNGAHRHASINEEEHPLIRGTVATAALAAIALVGCGVLLGSDPESSPGSLGPLGSSSGAGPDAAGPNTCGQCPPPSNPCVTSACADGRCVEVAKGGSAPIAGDNAGACIERYCDDGQVLTRDAPSCVSGASKGICRKGACTVPPSCNGLEACGRNLDESCCASITVPGGSYRRRYDGWRFRDVTLPATITSFALDKFEVTTARWNKFIAAGGGKATPPPPGGGAHPKHGESGWRSAWDGELTSLTGLPDDGRQPANINWYAAFAFCAWDGGRLPTEAEWGYVAAGGDEQRVYPWSDPPDSLRVEPGDAVIISFANDIARVGSATGASRWGHLDLTGNVDEWVRDQDSELAPGEACTDCIFTNDVNVPGAITKGGALRSGNWEGAARVVRSRSEKIGNNPGNATPIWVHGVRCARDL